MPVSRVAVSLRIPGLEKKPLVKITSLVYNSRVIEVYTMAKQGSPVAQLWNYCLLPELPFYVLLTLFSKLCLFVHSTQSCNQHSRPSKKHLCIARQRVCPLVSGNTCAKKEKKIDRFVTHFNAVVSQHSRNFLEDASHIRRDNKIWRSRCANIGNVVGT